MAEAVAAAAIASIVSALATKLSELIANALVIYATEMGPNIRLISASTELQHKLWDCLKKLELIASNGTRDGSYLTCDDIKRSEVIVRLLEPLCAISEYDELDSKRYNQILEKSTSLFQTLEENSKNLDVLCDMHRDFDNDDNEDRRKLELVDKLKKKVNHNFDKAVINANEIAAISTSNVATLLSLLQNFLATNHVNHNQSTSLMVRTLRIMGKASPKEVIHEKDVMAVGTLLVTFMAKVPEQDRVLSALDIFLSSEIWSQTELSNILVTLISDYFCKPIGTWPKFLGQIAKSIANRKDRQMRRMVLKRTVEVMSGNHQSNCNVDKVAVIAANFAFKVVLCQLEVQDDVDVAHQNGVDDLDMLFTNLRWGTNLTDMVRSELTAACFQSSPRIQAKFLVVLAKTGKLRLYCSNCKKDIPHDDETAKKMLKGLCGIDLKLLFNPVQRLEVQEIFVKDKISTTCDNIMSYPFILTCKEIADASDRGAFMKILLCASKHGQSNNDQALSETDLKALAACTLKLRKAYDDLRDYFIVPQNIRVNSTPEKINQGFDKHYALICRRLLLYVEHYKPSGHRPGEVPSWPEYSWLVDDLTFLIKNVRDVPMSYLVILQQEEKALDNFQNGGEAIQAAYREIFDTQQVVFWNSNVKSLISRIYGFYCYAKSTDFKSKLHQLNPPPSLGAQYSTITTAEIESICGTDSGRKVQGSEKKGELLGRDHLSNLGYKCIQQNQIAAVSCSMLKLSQNENIFMKVGTGQGKSLIIAWLAANYARFHNDSRVFVFSCFDHLAERDHSNFLGFFQALNVKSAYLNLRTPQDSYADAQVIYASLRVFFASAKAYAGNIFEAKNLQDLAGCPIFFGEREKDLCILDEFDSLVFEHAQHSNVVMQTVKILRVDLTSDEDIKDPHRFYAKLEGQNHSMSIANPNLTDAWEQLGFKEMLVSYCKRESKCIKYLKEDVNSLKKDVNSLGEEGDVIEGDFGEMKKGNCWFDAAYIPTLSFLKSFKGIVGLSGSIDKSEVGLLASIFKNKPCFIDIPGFSVDSEKATQVKTDYGLGDKEWLESILNDVQIPLMRGRPVLVFARPEVESQADWHILYMAFDKLVRDLNNLEEPGDSPFYESHFEFNCIAGGKNLVESLNGVAGDHSNVDRVTFPKTLTLASYVAGRGVDFKSSHEINLIGGLHVVITFEATLPHSRPPVCNNRLEVQMIGRTARMGAPGSYSVLTREKFDRSAEAKTKALKLKEDSKSCNLYLLSTNVVRTLCSVQMLRLSGNVNVDTKGLWAIWILFLHVVDRTGDIDAVKKLGSFSPMELARLLGTHIQTCVVNGKFFSVKFNHETLPTPDVQVTRASVGPLSSLGTVLNFDDDLWAVAEIQNCESPPAEDESDESLRNQLLQLAPEERLPPTHDNLERRLCPGCFNFMTRKKFPPHKGSCAVM